MKRFTFIDKLANEKWNVEITNIVQSQKFKGIYKSGAEQIMNLLKKSDGCRITLNSMEK